LTRFLFTGAAFAARAAGFSSGAAFSAAFAAAFAAGLCRPLLHRFHPANACVFSRYSNASPTSMSKKICADISAASLVYKAREISNQITTCPYPECGNQHKMPFFGMAFEGHNLPFFGHNLR
jgi:hypothetical protein